MAGLNITFLECGQGNRVLADRFGGIPKYGTFGALLMADKPTEIDFERLQKSARTDDLPLVVDL